MISNGSHFGDSRYAWNQEKIQIVKRFTDLKQKFILTLQKSSVQIFKPKIVCSKAPAKRMRLIMQTCCFSRFIRENAVCCENQTLSYQTLLFRAITQFSSIINNLLEQDFCCIFLKHNLL